MRNIYFLIPFLSSLFLSAQSQHQRIKETKASQVLVNGLENITSSIEDIKEITKDGNVIMLKLFKPLAEKQKSQIDLIIDRLDEIKENSDKKTPLFLREEILYLYEEYMTKIKELLEIISCLKTNCKEGISDIFNLEELEKLKAIVKDYKRNGFLKKAQLWMKEQNWLDTNLNVNLERDKRDKMPSLMISLELYRILFNRNQQLKYEYYDKLKSK